MTQTRSMLLNVGPSHPAMHGVIRMIMELDGEKIKNVDIEIGYLHRAFEKMCETVMYTQCFPVHRPFELCFSLDQQCWLCPDGRKIIRDRYTGACQIYPCHHERDLPCHRSFDLCRGIRHGIRGHVRVFVYDQGPRIFMGARRRDHGGKAYDFVCAYRRG